MHPLMHPLMNPLMNPSTREVLALINIIEAESDASERALLVKAARTAVRRLRPGVVEAISVAHAGSGTASAMALLNALLNDHPADDRCSRRTQQSVTAPSYA